MSQQQPESSPASTEKMIFTRRLFFLPYISSALFFLSGVCLLFSPLPLLYSYLKFGRVKGLAVILTNMLLVGALGGSVSSFIYFIIAVSLSISLGEFLLRKYSLEVSVVSTLIVMVFVSLSGLGIYSYFFQVNAFALVQEQATGLVTSLGETLTNRSSVDPVELEEWKASLLKEFPSAIAIFSLLLVWINVLVIFKMRGSPVKDLLGLKDSFLSTWKAPEHLVWPTLLVGGLWVAELGMVSDVGFNIFKFILAIYSLQGLSILVSLFNSWGLSGLPRLIGFGFSLFLMLPVVLSLGFFDLWFDFRSKFRQS